MLPFDRSKVPPGLFTALSGHFQHKFPDSLPFLKAHPIFLGTETDIVLPFCNHQHLSAVIPCRQIFDLITESQ